MASTEVEATSSVGSEGRKGEGGCGSSAGKASDSILAAPSALALLPQNTKVGSPAATASATSAVKAAPSPRAAAAGRTSPGLFGAGTCSSRQGSGSIPTPRAPSTSFRNTCPVEASATNSASGTGCASVTKSEAPPIHEARRSSLAAVADMATTCSLRGSGLLVFSSEFFFFFFFFLCCCCYCCFWIEGAAPL